jgi:hypothetical protein
VRPIYSSFIPVVGITPDFFTEKAIAQIDPPTTQTPLLSPIVKPRQELRSDMWDTFGGCIKDTAEANAQLLEAKGAQLSVYKRVLEAIQNDCGICWINGESAIHEAYNCPRIGNQKQFAEFRRSIRYRLKGYRSSPCWKCHICSFGSDYLHKEFTKKDVAQCPCPNLFPGLLFYCWFNKDMKTKMEALFEGTWASLPDWSAFLVQKTEEHSTQPMKLVAWLSETYL